MWTGGEAIIIAAIVVYHETKETSENSRNGTPLPQPKVRHFTTLNIKCKNCLTEQVKFLFLIVSKKLTHFSSNGNEYDLDAVYCYRLLSHHLGRTPLFFPFVLAWLIIYNIIRKYMLSTLLKGWSLVDLFERASRNFYSHSWSLLPIYSHSSQLLRAVAVLVVSGLKLPMTTRHIT